jgi:Class II Aldolase and Adducin N-terminal domain
VEGHTIRFCKETPVASKLMKARHELALANRIAANEGVLDTFGHASMRHPDNPNRYFLSRSSAPSLVTAQGSIEYDLDSRPLSEANVGQYTEPMIHGEIYKARPDVMAVCHHHAPSFMPLLITGTDYVPVFAAAGALALAAPANGALTPRNGAQTCRECQTGCCRKRPAAYAAPKEKVTSSSWSSFSSFCASPYEASSRRDYG